MVLKETKNGNTIKTRLNSWLANSYQGGHVGGVLVVNTIDFFLDEFT